MSPLLSMREIHELGPTTRERVIDVHALAPFRERGIAWAGLSEAGDGFALETRGWRCGRVVVCHRGRGEVWVRGRWAECAAGQAYLTPAGAAHGYHSIPGEPWGIVWLTFDPPHHRTPLDGLVEARLADADPRPLRYALLGLYYEHLDTSDHAVLEVWAELIEHLARRCAITDGSLNGARLWPIWEKVDADLARPWALQDLARLIDVSPEHLRRLTHKHLGRSPMDQVAHLRMRRAASLLRWTAFKIDVIAGQVGYADRFSFSAAFKRTHGVGPAVYRRQNAGTPASAKAGA